MVQQKSLLQKMEEAIGLIKVLQQEKEEATAKANTVENENREIKALLSLAESKADEMLAVRGSTPKDDSRPKLSVTEPKEEARLKFNITEQKEEARPKFNVTEQKETPAAVSFKSSTKEPDRLPVEPVVESETIPSMDQRTPISREPAATESDEAQKKPSEDQTRSWAELRERFIRPLSTS